MTHSAAADLPIAIDRVDRARGEGESVRLRLSGRWLGPGDPADHDPLLVVQLQGRRHRFPASREPADASGVPGAWRADFLIPSWAVPSRPGQAAVWVGNAVIAVGPPGSTSAPAAAPVVTATESEPAEAAPPAPAAQDPALAEALDVGRAGPLADLLLKDTVLALHAELERRSTETVQLRGALADAQSELEARAARQSGLESAHAELRHELEQLMEAVPRQRREFDDRMTAGEDQLARAREELAMIAAARDEAEAEGARARQQAEALQQRLGAQALTDQRQAQESASLREQLAAAQIARDAAASEVGALRSELERLGAELAVMREQVTAHGGGLGEAQQLLADARALTEQLRGESSA
jgi:hypothetical protein